MGGQGEASYKVVKFNNKFGADHDPKANPIRSLHLNIAFKPRPGEGAAELPDCGGQLGYTQNPLGIHFRAAHWNS